MNIKLSTSVNPTLSLLMSHLPALPNLSHTHPPTPRCLSADRRRADQNRLEHVARRVQRPATLPYTYVLYGLQRST